LLAPQAVQTLVSLGLSFLQAKVYLALVIMGSSTGRTAAKQAKVASQDVYRVLLELQEKGLVEKIIAKPNEYKAVSLKEGVYILLGRRENETRKLKKSVLEICSNFHTINQNEDFDANNQFVLIPEKKPSVNRFIKAFETAATSLDLMNDFQDAIVAHDKLFQLNVKALDSGVKIRDILCKTKESIPISKHFFTLLKREPAFQIRYLNFPCPAKLIIKDSKEAFISTKTKEKMIDQPHLWTNNPVLVRVIQEWFNGLWKKGIANGQVTKPKKLEILLKY
jgi:sugar-specific transcriptional regulator TrmB